MRLRLIKLLDEIDDRIIGHRFYSVCHWVANHRWWDA